METGRDKLKSRRNDKLIYAGLLMFVTFLLTRGSTPALALVTGAFVVYFLAVAAMIEAKRSTDSD